MGLRAGIRAGLPLILLGLAACGPDPARAVASRVQLIAEDLATSTRVQVAALADRALAKAESRLGHHVSHPVVVHMVRQVAQLPPPVRSAFRPWTVAITWTDRGEVWLCNERLKSEPPDDLPSVLLHELVHVVLGDLEQSLSRGSRSVPRWLHEGLAQEIAEAIYLLGSEHLVELRARTDQLARWSDLAADFPADESDARAAYAQSASFVAFLDRTIGLRPLLAALRAWLAGRAESLDLALSAEGFGTFTHRTGEWIEELRSGRGLLRYLSRSCFEVLILVAVPLLGIVLYKRFKREKRAGQRLEAFERDQEARAREQMSEE